MSTALREARQAYEAADRKAKEFADAAGGIDSLDHTKMAEVAKDTQGWMNEFKKLCADRDEKRGTAEGLAALVQEEQNRKRAEAGQRPPDHDPEAAKHAPTIGQTVTESAAWKHAFTHRVPTAHKNVREDAMGSDQLKATVTTTAGWGPESIRIPGLVVPIAYQMPRVIDVIRSVPTSQAAVVYMEETSWNNAAAERAEEAEYAETDFQLTERNNPVVSVGHRVTVTDEQLEDVAQVRAYIDGRMSDGLRRRVSDRMLNGAKTGVSIRGLLNIDGTGTEDEAASDDNVHETVYRAFVKMRVTAYTSPNLVIMHPNDFREIRLTKTTDGVYLFGNPDVAGSRTVWGVPVLETTEITENTVLSGDFSQCDWYSRRGIDVQVGFNADDFSKGRITIRAGLRGQLVTYRPSAFVKSTLQA